MQFFVTLFWLSTLRLTRGSLGPDVNGKYTLSSEGIRATFIPYGASISNLFINDTQGIERDIVLGFDNATYYSIDKSHPHLGGVPGRYANRIKNSSFTIDGETYHVLPNENPTPQYPQGVDTLHGGPDGWDWRNWTVVTQSESSITFSLVDPDGSQGFPGEVISYVTYTLTPNTWHIRMNAIATTKLTPIMLSSHVYWNLDGFQNPNTDLALGHVLSLPYGGLRIGTDSILVPDGNLLINEQGGLNDFWSAPKELGANFSNPNLLGNCGTGCTGYDTAYLNSPPSSTSQATHPIAELSSSWSKIHVSIYSEQTAFQVYTCNGQNGSLPLKTTQGFFDDATRPRVVQQYGCVVLEVEDWIGGINYPQWGREEQQVFGPETGQYSLEARYVFSLDG